MSLAHTHDGSGRPYIELTASTERQIALLVAEALAIEPDNSTPETVLEYVLDSLAERDDLEDGEDTLIAAEVDFRLALLGDANTNKPSALTALRQLAPEMVS